MFVNKSVKEPITGDENSTGSYVSIKAGMNS